MRKKNHEQKLNRMRQKKCYYKKKESQITVPVAISIVPTFTPTVVPTEAPTVAPTEAVTFLPITAKDISE